MPLPDTLCGCLQFHEVLLLSDHLAIISEFADGGDLADCIDRHKASHSGKALSENTARSALVEAPSLRLGLEPPELDGKDKVDLCSHLLTAAVTVCKAAAVQYTVLLSTVIPFVHPGLHILKDSRLLAWPAAAAPEFSPPS